MMPIIPNIFHSLTGYESLMFALLNLNGVQLYSMFMLSMTTNLVIHTVQITLKCLMIWNVFHSLGTPNTLLEIS